MVEITKQQKIDEVLNITQEECAEVIQVISKIKRFGIENQHIASGLTNTDKLHEEVGDLLAMVELLVSYKLLDNNKLDEAKRSKFAKLEKWSIIYK